MMKRYKRTSISQYVFVGLILLGVVALCFISAAVMRIVPFEDQFVLPWAASRMWLFEGASPYEDTVITFAEETLSASSYLGSLSDSASLVDPAINLIFYLPFSLIPYEISRAIWVTMLMLVVGLIGYLAFVLSGWKTTLIEKISLVVLTIFWLPGINSILTGQLTPVIILLILASIYFILRKEDTKAGFLLALTFGSFFTSALLLFLMVIWSIYRRRWSILTTYLSGVIFLILLTILLLPSWPLEWLRVILDTYRDWSWVNTPLMGLAALLPGIATYLSIALHILFVIYLITLVITLCRKSGVIFSWKIFSLLVVIFLFHVQASTDQLFLVLPAAFLMFRYWSERWRLFGRIFTWVLIATILGVPWLLNGVDPLIFVETMALPGLVVGFPILVIVGMVWIRWWALSIPKLPFETH